MRALYAGILYYCSTITVRDVHVVSYKCSYASRRRDDNIEAFIRIQVYTRTAVAFISSYTFFCRLFKYYILLRVQYYYDRVPRLLSVIVFQI